MIKNFNKNSCIIIDLCKNINNILNDNKHLLLKIYCKNFNNLKSNNTVNISKNLSNIVSIDDYIHNKLYNKEYNGYYSEINSIPIGKIKKPYNIKNIKGANDYLKQKEENYPENTYITASEELYPYFGHTIGNYILNSINQKSNINFNELVKGNKSIKVIEVGFGAGGLIDSILDYLKSSNIRIYKNFKYIGIENNIHLYNATKKLLKKNHENIINKESSNIKLVKTSIYDTHISKYIEDTDVSSNIYVMVFCVFNSLPHIRIKINNKKNVIKLIKKINNKKNVVFNDLYNSFISNCNNINKIEIKNTYNYFINNIRKQYTTFNYNKNDNNDKSKSLIAKFIDSTIKIYNLNLYSKSEYLVDINRNIFESLLNKIQFFLYLLEFFDSLLINNKSNKNLFSLNFIEINKKEHIMLNVEDAYNKLNNNENDFIELEKFFEVIRILGLKFYEENDLFKNISYNKIVKLNDQKEFKNKEDFGVKLLKRFTNYINSEYIWLPLKTERLISNIVVNSNNKLNDKNLNVNYIINDYDYIFNKQSFVFNIYNKSNTCNYFGINMPCIYSIDIKTKQNIEYNNIFDLDYCSKSSTPINIYFPVDFDLIKKLFYLIDSKNCTLLNIIKHKSFFNIHSLDYYLNNEISYNVLTETNINMSFGISN